MFVILIVMTSVPHQPRTYCTHSAQWFLILFLSSPDQEIEHTINDALMRFFDQCTRFVEEVDGNPSALSEVENFKEGPEMMRVREKIADRLRVPYNNITYGESVPDLYLY